MPFPKIPLTKWRPEMIFIHNPLSKDTSFLKRSLLTSRWQPCRLENPRHFQTSFQRQLQALKGQFPMGQNKRLYNVLHWFTSDVGAKGGIQTGGSWEVSVYEAFTWRYWTCLAHPETYNRVPSQKYLTHVEQPYTSISGPSYMFRY